MKKIIILGLVLTFIAPHIVLASWWNPFSWNIFNRKDQKTLTLENKVKELELKLDNVTATTSQKLIPATTSPISASSKLKEVTVKTKTNNSNKNFTDQEENFATVLSAEYNSRYELYNNYIDQIINPAIDYVDNGLNRMMKTRNESAVGPRSDFADILLTLYDKDIQWTKNTKTFLLGYKSKFTEKANLLKKQSVDVLNKNISREEAILIMKSLGDVGVDANLKSEFSAGFEQYKSGRIEFDGYYEDMFAKEQTKINQQLQRNKYEPTPTVNRIQQTNCSMLGNSLNCISY